MEMEHLKMHGGEKCILMGSYNYSYQSSPSFQPSFWSYAALQCVPDQTEFLDCVLLADQTSVYVDY